MGPLSIFADYLSISNDEDIFTSEVYIIGIIILYICPS